MNHPLKLYVFEVKILFSEIDCSFIFQGQSYQWLEFKDGLAKGDVALKLVDEGFLTRKESSYWKKEIHDKFWRSKSASCGASKLKSQHSLFFSFNSCLFWAGTLPFK